MKPILLGLFKKSPFILALVNLSPLWTEARGDQVILTGKGHLSFTEKYFLFETKNLFYMIDSQLINTATTAALTKGAIDSSLRKLTLEKRALRFAWPRVTLPQEETTNIRDPGPYGEIPSVISQQRVIQAGDFYYWIHGNTPNAHPLDWKTKLYHSGSFERKPPEDFIQNQDDLMTVYGVLLLSFLEAYVLIDADQTIFQIKRENPAIDLLAKTFHPGDRVKVTVKDDDLDAIWKYGPGSNRVQSPKP